jgi:hypothetical protein
MASSFTIDRALADPRLLGAALGPSLDSWQTWRIVLKAAFALPLSDEERKVFAAIAGDRGLPKQRVRELWAVVARRGGKSRTAAAAGCYLACFMPRNLAPGEVGEVTIIAATREQANVVFKYVVGFLQESPVLCQEIEGLTATEVRLRGNVVLSTRAGNYRTVRGRTLLAAIIDEVAFLRDESSSMPDIETYRALLPALATTGGMLIGISTPYRRIGLLYQKHRDYFGVDDPDVLVVAGDSQRFNPTLDQSIIERARASDPEGARAEWDAEFRSDISGYLDDATVECAIDYARPLELPPQPGLFYRAFTDASGGRHDHYTCAVGHKDRESGRYIIDVVRGIAPPFDPVAATQEFAALLKHQYRVGSVTGDAFGQEWVAGAWRSCGVLYVQADQPKAAIYLETLPLWAQGLVSIPNHARLLREVRLLERRTHRSGRDSVDHGRSGHDDYVNAVAGVLRGLACHLGYDLETLRRAFGDDEDADAEAARARRDEEYRRAFAQRIFMLSGGQYWPR